MAIADSAATHFDIGRVVGRTFSVIKNNLITFGALSLIVALPYLAVTWNSARFRAGLFRDGRFDSDAMTFVAVSWFIYLLSTFLLQATVIHATVAYLNEKPAPVASCLATGLSSLLQLILITVLMFSALIAGMMLFVIPGIILAIMWFVAVPACVVERTGVIGAFRRSRELTRGHRWAIFGLYVVFLIFSIGLAAALQTPTTVEGAVSAAANPSIAQISISVTVTTFTSTVGSTLVASIYYELRQIKDGIGPEALASVFD
jgi:hypothetical protein